MPDFTYNGNNPANGGAGRSWFFTYGQTLVANGTTKAVWTDERGFQTTFAGNDASGYQASNPADAEGSVVKIGSDYELRTPDGVRRTFVGGSKGFWKKTVDRWGGGAEGNATTSSRSTLVNELVGGATTGRAITMIYDAVSRVTTLIDVNSGNTRFGYDGSGRLITICAADNDQNCPATTNPWRRFEYDGVTDRLVRVTDALGGIQRAYHYTAAGELDQTWVAATTYAAGKARTQYVRSGSPPNLTLTVKREKGDGTTADTIYTPKAIGGVWRVESISGACPECGEENSTRTFDSATGRLLTRTNGNGFLTTFGYDADGNVTQIVEASGTPLARTTTYTYAVPGTDALPSPWPTAPPILSPRDFWKTKTEPSGVKPGSNVVTTRSWAGSGNLELSEIASGFLSSTGSAVQRTTKTTYDSSGRIISIDGPRPLPTTDITTFVYYLPTDPLNNRHRLKQTTTPDNTLVKFEYHPLGGISKLTRDKGTGTADTVTEYSYDAVGRRTNETVRLTPATAELDLVTTSVFDVVGRLASTEIKEGLTPLTKTKFVYELGTDRMLNRTNPDGRFGAESGERTTYTYDDRGNVTRETHGYFNGAGTTTEYDVTRLFDGLCRVKKQTFPVDSATTRYVYDCAGNMTGVVDANHYVTDGTPPNLSYGYDALNRLTSVTRTAAPTNDQTLYGYDLRNQFTSVTDPNGALTTYVVDDFGGLRKQITPLAGGGVADETTYEYDEANDLTSTTQTGIRATNRTYDAAGRLTSIVYVSGGPLATVTYTYDTLCLPDPITSKIFGQGRLCKVTDGTSTSEYAYDRRGLVVKDKVTLVATPGPGSKVYELTYQYDAAGRRKQITYPSPGDSVMVSFDVNNRPLGMTYTPSGGFPSKLVSKVAHQINGPIRSFQTSGNLQEARTFDTRFRRLTQRTFSLSTNPMTLLVGWQYGDGRISSSAYDKEGNLLVLNDVTPGISPPSNRTFGYDPDRYFLTSSTGPYGSSFASQTLSWIYDKNGNRTTETRAGSPTTYTYENDGSGHSNGVIATLSPGGAVTHLNSGDLNLDEQLVQHSYDALGRLIEASSTSGCATFPARNVLKRDAMGHRVIRQVYVCNSSALSKTEYLVYGSDGNLYYREVFNGSSNLTDREAYVYLEGEPVAILRTFGTPTGNFFLHDDHLGRPLAMTGSDGFLKWKGEFEPFGKTLAPRTKATTLEPAFRFPGQWEYSDSENVTQTGSTGVLGKINALDDNWNRTYAFRWGRYTQPDPLAQILPVWQDSRHSSQLFGYAASNPLFFVDRNGLAPEGSGGQCCDCPEGIWGYSGVTNGIGLIIGYTNFHGTFTCRSKPSLQVPVDGYCWSGGLQAFATVFSYQTSAGALIPGAKACKVTDLFGKEDSLTVSSTLFVGASGNLNDSTGTVNVGVGVGAGFAAQTCTTKPYKPLNPTPGAPRR